MNKTETLEYIRQSLSGVSRTRPTRHAACCATAKHRRSWCCDFAAFSADDYREPLMDIITQDDTVDTIRAVSSMNQHEWECFQSDHPRLARHVDRIRRPRRVELEAA